MTMNNGTISPMMNPAYALPVAGLVRVSMRAQGVINAKGPENALSCYRGRDIGRFT